MSNTPLTDTRTHVQSCQGFAKNESHKKGNEDSGTRII